MVWDSETSCLLSPVIGVLAERQLLAQSWGFSALNPELCSWNCRAVCLLRKPRLRKLFHWGLGVHEFCSSVTIQAEDSQYSLHLFLCVNDRLSGGVVG